MSELLFHNISIMQHLTPAQKRVYQALLQIPYGKVVSYGDLGKKLWLHPRSVGRLLSKNQEPDKYPCFKVVAFDGKLTGYALGLEEKERRLKAEGIQVIEGKVEEKYLCTL